MSLDVATKLKAQSLAIDLTACLKQVFCHVAAMRKICEIGGDALARQPVRVKLTPVELVEMLQLQVLDDYVRSTRVGRRAGGTLPSERRVVGA